MALKTKYKKYQKSRIESPKLKDNQFFERNHDHCLQKDLLETIENGANVQKTLYHFANQMVKNINIHNLFGRVLFKIFSIFNTVAYFPERY